MPASLGDRIRHAWNAFTNQPQYSGTTLGTTSAFRQDGRFYRAGNERSIVSTIYTRIAVDVASTDFFHVRQDQNGRFVEVIHDGIHECITVESNIDQTAFAFFIDLTLSLVDEGVIAVVPVDTTVNLVKNNSFDIKSLRVGKIEEWYPKHVKINLYNENKGVRESIILPKKSVAIIQNPFYDVMNQPNSTLQRLIRKLNLLDVVDEQNSSGKLDMIIQLPYVVKSEARKQQAQSRAKDIEVQLTSSKYGIAYVDGTEKITQLNRPVENNLMSQVEYLTKMLYSQLGLTEEIFNGSASESAMLNYNNRTIGPILTAILSEFRRKFLTKTARSQLQSFMYFKDPFKLIPISNIAEIADKFTRNEILTPNEIRGIIGLKPANDPNADELRNRNINQNGSESSENLVDEESPSVGAIPYSDIV